MKWFFICFIPIFQRPPKSGAEGEWIKFLRYLFVGEAFANYFMQSKLRHHFLCISVCFYKICIRVWKYILGFLSQTSNPFNEITKNSVERLITTSRWTPLLRNKHIIKHNTWKISHPVLYKVWQKKVPAKFISVLKTPALMLHVPMAR